MDINTEKENVKTKVDEYYKLKAKYEEENHKKKREIIGKKTLSWKEKRSEYKKLVPKCINCKRPGGTVFSTKFYDEINGNFDEHRQLKAVCGVIIEPCNLNITINVGKYSPMPEILNEIERNIVEIKHDIIEYKNKLLFGFLSADQAFTHFNKMKDILSDYTTQSQAFMEIYVKIVDNDEEKQILKEDIEKSYIFIESIKKNISQFNETSNTQFVHDAVTTYVTNLKPLLKKILYTKYRENLVWFNDETNAYHLLQKKNTIQDLEFNEGSETVVSFSYGEEIATKGKIALVSTRAEKENPTPQAARVKEKTVAKPKEAAKAIRRLPKDEPIYEEDKNEISWRIPEYKMLWEKLPPNLKGVLKEDKEWVKQFMFVCVNDQANGKECTMVAPPDLKVPPNQIELPGGEYDFGVPIYNEAFNKLSPLDKNNFLKLSVEKDGVKTYDNETFRRLMNNAVLKELGINSQYIPLE